MLLDRRFARLRALSAVWADRRRVGPGGARRADRARRLQHHFGAHPRPHGGGQPDFRPVARFRRPGAPGGRVRPPARQHGNEGRGGARQGALDRPAARRRDRGTLDAGQAARRFGVGARAQALAKAAAPRRAGHADGRADAPAACRPQRCRRPRDAAHASPPAQPETRVASFKGRSQAAIIALIRGAIDAGKIDLYLQPIVTLPQRKVRYYESMSRLKADDGEIVAAGDFLAHAEAGALMPQARQPVDAALRAGGAAAAAQEPRHRAVLQHVRRDADRRRASRNSSNSPTPTAPSRRR